MAVTVTVTVTVTIKIVKTSLYKKVRSPDSRLLNEAMKSKERRYKPMMSMARVMMDKEGGCWNG